MYLPKSSYERILAALMAIQASVVVVCQLVILLEWQSWVRPNAIQVANSWIIPLDSALLAFLCAYSLYLTWDGMRRQNNILIFAVCLMNACTLAFTAFWYGSVADVCTVTLGSRDAHDNPLVDITRNIWPSVKVPLLITPISTAICCVVGFYLAWELHKQYAWAIYRSVQGSAEMRSRYLVYEVYLVLIKLDLFFIVAFLLQYGLIDVHFDEPEFSLTMALLPFSFIVIFSSVYFVRKENMPIMIFVTTCYFGMIAYLISRLVVLYGHSLLASTSTKELMVLFAMASLILTTLALICGIRCMVNFGHGLKLILAGKSHYVLDQHQFHTIPLPGPSLHDVSPHSPFSTNRFFLA